MEHVLLSTSVISMLSRRSRRAWSQTSALFPLHTQVGPSSTSTITTSGRCLNLAVTCMNRWWTQAGKNKDRLTESASYPVELNKWLAEQVVFWLSRSSCGLGGVFTRRDMPTEIFSTTDEKEVDARDAVDMRDGSHRQRCKGKVANDHRWRTWTQAKKGRHTSWGWSSRERATCRSSSYRRVA